MVTLEKLQQYVKGYSDRRAMLEVAFRFFKLGERLLDIAPSELELYTDAHSFIYDTIVKGYRKGPARSADVVFSEDEIPVEYKQDCDEFVPELSCSIEILDSDSALIHSDTRLFPLPFAVNERHFVGFAREALEKAAKTASMAIGLDDFTLATFAHYAFMMGAGMPVRDAVNSRRYTIQKEYYSLQ
jgi:hypothetical protein